MKQDEKKLMDSLPKKYQGVFEKAMAGNSKSNGIKAKCLDCCCWQESEARDCGVPLCPLFPYNPYRKRVEKRIRLKGEASEENKTQD